MFGYLILLFLILNNNSAAIHAEICSTDRYIYIYIYSLTMTHLRGDERVCDSSCEATPKIVRRSYRLVIRCPISPRIVVVNAHIALPMNRLTSCGHSLGIARSLRRWLSTLCVHCFRSVIAMIFRHSLTSNEIVSIS